MTDIEVLEGATVVVRGFFNAAVFSPAWFLQQELIGPGEFRDSSINFITRDVAQFKMGWLDCFVENDTLQLSTSVPEEFERVRDAAAGVLRLLSHTPVGAVGINRDSHIRVKSIDAWHKIGDALTPKAVWQDALSLPGMRDVTLWGQRTDGLSGHVQVQVQPSTRIPQAVYVGHNDHYTLNSYEPAIERSGVSWDLSVEGDVQPSAERIKIVQQILSENWRDSMARADKAVQLVISLAD